MSELQNVNLQEKFKQLIAAITAKSQYPIIVGDDFNRLRHTVLGRGNVEVSVDLKIKGLADLQIPDFDELRSSSGTTACATRWSACWTPSA